MIRFFDSITLLLVGSSKRSFSLFLACLFCLLNVTFSPLSTPPALAEGNGVNVIIMIGDGMGWNMARAAAAAKTGTLYKAGKGQGLNFQKLKGYTYTTTYGTTIDATNATTGAVTSSTGNSALDNSNPITGQSPIRPGFQFNPAINPGTPARDLTATANQPCRNGGDPGKGNIVGYEIAKGGPTPWIPLSPAVPQGTDPEYIKCSYPDSANTASTLYTGVKSYNNAMSVDIYEQADKTILQTARELGKSTGLVTSVPITHATPGAAASSVNRRNKYDADFPALDNILQEALREDQGYLPTVLLGGGHPLDFLNTTAASTVTPKGFEYIKQSTYEELRDKPTNNRYGYTFVERDTRVTTTTRSGQIRLGGKTLLETAKKLDPNQGDRLLGLFGARGQDGNIPTLSANGDYSLTGLSNFSVYSTAAAPTNATGTPINNGTQIPKPDTVRPLATAIAETNEQFIAKEVRANPTLAQMTRAALEVLGKDKDGFWLMVEGGDIDWAAHDNNLDNLIGTMTSFDNAVKEVTNWVSKNGGWKKNVLIVTADHDHYLTLNDNYAELVKANGAEALTFNKNTPAEAGHFWGSDPAIKYGWGNHSNRLVPVYFQGDTFKLLDYVGSNVEFVDRPPGGTAKTYQIPGVPGAVDQSHIYKAMLAALKS
ncbi:alkaline phosphatase [Phormidesmis sp. 146-12]